MIYVLDNISDVWKCTNSIFNLVEWKHFPIIPLDTWSYRTSRWKIFVFDNKVWNEEFLIRTNVWIKNVIKYDDCTHANVYRSMMQGNSKWKRFIFNKIKKKYLFYILVVMLIFTSYEMNCWKFTSKSSKNKLHWISRFSIRTKVLKITLDCFTPAPLSLMNKYR